MINEDYEPTKAEMLANLVTGNAGLYQTGATVQRSHRFPLIVMIEIENLAKVAGVPISVIINKLIECGLEAVRQELPSDVVDKLCYATKEQVERPTKNVKVAFKGRNLTTPNKPKVKKS